MLTIELQGDKELVAKLGAMPSNIQRALWGKVNSLADMLQSYIINSKLSGQVLNHRSGDLWRSIHPSATQSSTEVTGYVKSEGVKYAAHWEYGGTIPEHVVEAVNGQSLAFVWKGKQCFFKRVTIPARTDAPRSFMRTALADKKQEIIDGLTEAVKGAVQ